MTQYKRIKVNFNSDILLPGSHFWSSLCAMTDLTVTNMENKQFDYSWPLTLPKAYLTLSTGLACSERRMGVL